jgi:hypothetical protein
MASVQGGWVSVEQLPLLAVISVVLGHGHDPAGFGVLGYTKPCGIMELPQEAVIRAATGRVVVTGARR